MGKSEKQQQKFYSGKTSEFMSELKGF